MYIVLGLIYGHDPYSGIGVLFCSTTILRVIVFVVRDNNLLVVESERSSRRSLDLKRENFTLNWTKVSVSGLGFTARHSSL